MAEKYSLIAKVVVTQKNRCKESAGKQGKTCKKKYILRELKKEAKRRHLRQREFLNKPQKNLSTAEILQLAKKEAIKELIS